MRFRLYFTLTTLVIASTNYCDVALAQAIGSTASVKFADATAAITFANGSSLQVTSGSGRFPLVAATASENLKVQLQFPANAKAGLIVQSLDGGVVSSADSTVSAGGSSMLQFTPGTQPGLYRVLLNQGDRLAILQFWVGDPQRPNAGPPALSPSTGN